MLSVLKAEDPHHLVIGAIQCADAWMWTDVPSYLQPDSKFMSGAVIPAGAQPRLQLSLDLILWEHYADTLSAGPQGQEWSPHVPPSAAAPAWGADGNAMIRVRVKITNYVLKTMKFVSQTRICVLKMMNFAFKMMDSSRRLVLGGKLW